MSNFINTKVNSTLNQPEHTNDVQRTAELHHTLMEHDAFISQVEQDHRRDILRKLESLYKYWVKYIAVLKFKYTDLEAQQLGGKIYPFGSYHLGADIKGADLDVLCVAPRIIKRSEFFSIFFVWLTQMPEVTECRSIEDSYVPVIKLKFSGVEMDLTFARLELDVISDDLDLSDDNLLRNLDPQSVRSLNGSRVNDAILAFVPNVENFRLALRAIKLWAKKRAINNNALGSFGGITYAILTAKICQMFPNAEAATIILNFFKTYVRWQWPTPVLLMPCSNFANLDFPVWDPVNNPRDGAHLLPVITPMYPQQNSTHNVTHSMKKLIKGEIHRGVHIMENIIDGRVPWNNFFEEPSFFANYRQFIVLSAYSQTTADHVAWHGYVESKIRILISNLERSGKIFLAHINPNWFVGESPVPTSPHCSKWFIGLKLERLENVKNVNLTDSMQNFKDHVLQHAEKIKAIKGGMGIILEQQRAARSAKPKHIRHRNNRRIGTDYN